MAYELEFQACSVSALVPSPMSTSDHHNFRFLFYFDLVHGYTTQCLGHPLSSLFKHQSWQCLGVNVVQNQIGFGYMESRYINLSATLPPLLILILSEF